MGQEIDYIQFTPGHFADFSRHLTDETQLLADWFKQQKFATDEHVGGFELEVWIVDQNFNPIPINDSYLKRLNSDWVTPELSRFNIELNGNPEQLQSDALTRLHNSLQQSWDHCYQVAADFDASLVMIGILPSVREDQLVIENMSRLKRYEALNEQVFRQRQGRPLKLDIHGREHLHTTHYDVMLESAATSFQVHWQVPINLALRAYNASLIASAVTVAVSANSPYLFGKDLWDETRIPLFEQSVEVGGIAGAAFGPMRRVSFGSGYARHSLFELFNENHQHFPVLLPIDFNTDDEQMSYLRLHNGTIWRWNRPLIGFDAEQQPHMRIEHRVITAGPTVTDNIANAAFYYGLANYLAMQPEPPEEKLDFAHARDNFYACAKSGLSAQVMWLDKQKGNIKDLLQNQLLGQAEQGLQSLGLAESDVKLYIGVIRERVKNEQHGANWQREYVHRHQCNMQDLTAAYHERQQSGQPVSTWAV